MTVVHIQIDEKKDKIGFSVGRTKSTTKKELSMARGLSGVIQTAVSATIEKLNKEKENVEPK